MRDEVNRKFRVIALGDAGVGKTSLLTRYVHSTFSERRKPTVGVDHLRKKYRYGPEMVEVKVFDPVGQDRFRSLLTAFYRDVDMCFLMFDLTNKESFRNAYYWYNEFKEKNNNTCESEFVILIGNKSDLKERTVSEKDIGKFLSHTDISCYYECSVKSGTASRDFIDGKIHELVKEKKAQEELCASIVESDTFVLSNESILRKPRRSCDC
mmetsp:Transcript_21007/g.23765  ORF Transcript_21007/g.23765 Transcript_21007/m.23765 type:complete len:210 (+) Transcript_21007:1177-1806(+)|eukprot:CAMPEP_0115008084 /NCGR_PEP_ID=MMETSP0216-20121206/21664_1 /TAXON_ID=223996 /ORGANISM="Protocruzia adherens, Strain Boccale" /LENGTH=209 /DNA_ID=CAMNT_0002375349 /DNA_START=695 /DNA_END=1324 /DNA_ORIENTATION=-